MCRILSDTEHELCMWFVAIWLPVAKQTHTHRSTKVAPSSIENGSLPQHLRKLYGCWTLDISMNLKEINPTPLVLQFFHDCISGICGKTHWRHCSRCFFFFFFLRFSVDVIFLIGCVLRLCIQHKILYNVRTITRIPPLCRCAGGRLARLVLFVYKYIAIALRPYAAHLDSKPQASIVGCLSFFVRCTLRRTHTHTLTFYFELMNGTFKVEQTINLICHQHPDPEYCERADIWRLNNFCFFFFSRFRLVRRLPTTVFVVVIARHVVLRLNVVNTRPTRSNLGQQQTPCDNNINGE